jgi:carboxyvinyl-carboxyphosphonate phosphorylmutase
MSDKNPTQRREQFRAILAGDLCVHPASVFDPISARIAEDLGFELAFMAGCTASATVLGAPDLVVLTLTEFAEQIRRICRAAKISLVVDADHGYGNALNVKRTVEELETAGLAGLTIEDTVCATSELRQSQRRGADLPGGGGREDESRPGGTAGPQPGNYRSHRRAAQ